MRKIVTAMFVSLDGVVQAPGGPEEDTSGGFKFGGWTFPYFDEAGGKVMEELFKEKFDLLLGRKTYDIFAGYWPKVTEAHPDHAIGKVFNEATKYVATHRPKTLKWERTEWLGKNPVAALKKLKKSDGPTLLTQGSADFIQTLLADDLIDRLTVLTFPVMLGKGKRLFGKGTRPGALKLVRSIVTPSGVMVGTYERDGKVKTGSFGPAE